MLNRSINSRGWLSQLFLGHIILMVAGLLLHLFLLSFETRSAMQQWVLWSAVGSFGGFVTAWLLRFLALKAHRNVVVRSVWMDLFFIFLTPLPIYLLTAHQAPLRALLGAVILFCQGRELLRTDRRLGVLHLRRKAVSIGSITAVSESIHYRAWCLSFAAGLVMLQMYNGGNSYSLPSSPHTFAARVAFVLGAVIMVTLVEIRSLWYEFWVPTGRDIPAGAFRFLRQLWATIRALPCPFWFGLATLVWFLKLFCASPHSEFAWIPLALLHQLLACLFLHYASRKPSQLMAWFFNHPAHMLATSFAVLIAIGGYLLTLPFCDPAGHGIGVVDALFTAASATSVTGLTVLDVSTQLTHAGHVVLAVCIQLGGLGIMTVSTFVAVAIGHRMGQAEIVAVADMTCEERGLLARRLLWAIVLLTFAIEAVGTCAFAWYFYAKGSQLPLSQLLWQSYFMSLNAFCNSGFSLIPDSYVSFQNQLAPLYIGATLIILGGLGYGVITGTFTLIFRRTSHRTPTHVKVVLTVSAILLFVGTLLLFFLEQDRSFADMSFSEQLANAFFQSASSRSGGLNSVDLTQMHPVSQFLLRVLMFCGAAPGSMGGGIRVTTVAVLAMLVWAMVRGRSQVVVNRRTIPENTVHQAVAALIIGLVVVVCGSLLLSWDMPDATLPDVIFEVVSALGTVGMSMGITAKTSSFGKILLIIMMFIGRIGFLTLLATMRTHKYTPQVKYPTGRIFIG